MEYIKQLDETVYRNIKQEKVNPELLELLGIENNKVYYASNVSLTCYSATQPGQLFRHQIPTGYIYYITLQVKHKNASIWECLSIH